jgi:deoxyribodipyrimidine photo-lyase
MSPARVGRRPVVLWFRRDLRLTDHPALAEAAAQGPITALFVLDDVLLRTAGEPRLAYLLRTLRALDEQLRAQGGALTVRAGRPEHVVPAVVDEAKATAVHITADFAPYGTTRDQRVASALGAVPLLATGSPYAVAPGRLLKSDGRAYQVFTPFYRAWLARGWELPACIDVESIAWWPLDGVTIPGEPTISATLPNAGEPAARAAWDAFRNTRLATYAGARDQPALDATSRLSPFLKLGALHPRTLLADLGPDDDAFRRQLAWREFYASVLSDRPSTARSCFQPRMDGMRYDRGAEADARFAAWTSGRTGYPLVDAGMRQLLREGWMHNRLRMITASFLVKDLHVDWIRGAEHFMRHLIDGDLASNQHGWQWVAGAGTDAAPYFRIFNPVSQGRKFDPDGGYIRRWVHELSHLPSSEIHEPWRRSRGLPSGYPARIVEHREERAESLARYEALRAHRGATDPLSARP